MYKPKIKRKPIKNSKPIINRAMNGANFHPPIPKSTKVYSNGSIGYNLVYALNKKTKPKTELSKKKSILIRIGFMEYKSLRSYAFIQKIMVSGLNKR